MKNVARVFVSLAAMAVCPVAALANQLLLDSSSSTVTYVGYNSSATFSAAPGTVNGWTAQGPTAAVNLTYNATAAQYWAAPIGTSTWVSYEANTQPGGSATGGVGAYEYMSNAFGTTSGQPVQLSVLADNTTAVYLVNGLNQSFLIVSYPAGYPATIDGAVPDYSTVDNIIIPSSELTATGDKLYFDVSNTANFGSNPPGSPTGLDFELNSLSPEPSSLLLLATGMVGAVGAFRRRAGA